MEWWSWSNPSFLLSFSSAVTGVMAAAAAIIIPIIIYRSARKGEFLINSLLEEQRKILALQRRDDILDRLSKSEDGATVAAFTSEVNEFKGSEEDKRLLQRVVRAHALTPLPYQTDDCVEAQDFIDSLESRYTKKKTPGISWEYGEFLDFLCNLDVELGQKNADKISGVLTGPAASVQMPSHKFYREIVTAGGWYLVPSLLYRAAKLPNETQGGLRLNIFTGVLLGCKDLALSYDSDKNRENWENNKNISQPPDFPVFRRDLQVALAGLLSSGKFSNLSAWSTEGSTEAASAMVAWLIFMVGANCGIDSHLDMRCVENLASCIQSIPWQSFGWGQDTKDVQFGLKLINEIHPDLWSKHGTQIAAACGETIKI